MFVFKSKFQLNSKFRDEINFLFREKDQIDQNNDFGETSTFDNKLNIHL